MEYRRLLRQDHDHILFQLTNTVCIDHIMSRVWNTAIKIGSCSSDEDPTHDTLTTSLPFPLFLLLRFPLAYLFLDRYHPPVEGGPYSVSSREHHLRIVSSARSAFLNIYRNIIFGCRERIHGERFREVSTYENPSTELCIAKEGEEMNTVYHSRYREQFRRLSLRDMLSIRYNSKINNICALY